MSRTSRTACPGRSARGFGSALGRPSEGRLGRVGGSGGFPRLPAAAAELLLLRLAEGTGEPRGVAGDRVHQHRGVEEDVVATDAAAEELDEHLGEQHREEGDPDDTWAAAEATDHHDDDEQQRLLVGEGQARDDADRGPEERAGQSGHRSRQHERQQLEARDVDAERRGDLLVGLDGVEGPAQPGAGQVDVQLPDEDQQQQTDGQQVAVAGDRVGADVRRRDHLAGGAASDPVALEQRLRAGVDDPDRDDGEVETAQPQGGEPDEEREPRTEQHRADDADEPGQPGVEDAREVTHREGTRAHEGELPQRDLAGVAHQQVERQRGESGDAAGAEQQRIGVGQQHGAADEGRDHRSQDDREEDPGDRQRRQQPAAGPRERHGGHAATCSSGAGGASRALITGSSCRPSSTTSRATSTTTYRRPGSPLDDR